MKNCRVVRYRWRDPFDTGILAGTYNDNLRDLHRRPYRWDIDFFSKMVVTSKNAVKKVAIEKAM